MAAVGLLWWAELRSRWRAWLGVAALIGLAGGAVTGLIAGARRTDSAYDRFRAGSDPADVVVLAPTTGEDVDLAVAAGMDGVAAAVQVRSYVPAGGRVEGRELPVAPVVVLAWPEGELGSSVERRQVVAGRHPDPGRPDELLVSHEAAQRYDLEPGSMLELDLFDEEGLAIVFREVVRGLPDRLSGRDDSEFDVAAVAGAVPYRFTVVGVSVSPADFPPLPASHIPSVYSTPAFEDAVGRELFAADGLYVRLRSDVSVAEYQERLEGDPRTAVGTRPGRSDFGLNGAEHADASRRLISTEAGALWLLAGLVAAAAALVVLQALVRQAWFTVADHPPLRALGTSRVQLWGVGALRAGGIAMVAGSVVVLIALALSPLFPFGVAGRAEPAPGFRVDTLAVAIGAAVTAAAVLIISLSTEAWRLGRKPSATPLRGRGARWPWGPLTLRLGSRLVLSAGQGRTGVPVRSAVVSMMAAVTAAVVAVTLIASLDHLTHTPRLYGWSWDAEISGATADIGEPLTEGLRQNPAIEALAVGAIAQLEVEGERVDGYALDDAKGRVSAVLLDGRPPAGADEIVLGTITLEEIGASVGDTVEVSSGGRSVPMRVVGRGVFPNIGDVGQLGRGARLTFSGLEELAPRPRRTLALLDVADGRDVDQELADLRRGLGFWALYDDRPPADLANLEESNGLPALVAVTVAAVAAAALVHTLITSVRRQRRELALLKATGLTSQRLSAVVAWQATILSAVALVAGIPLGVAGGRWAWIWIGRQFGFQPEPVVPLAQLAIVGLAVVALANLVAIGPAWAAGRTRTAAVLQAE